MNFATGLKDQQDANKQLSNTDRQDILRNIQFIKNNKAQLFEDHKLESRTQRPMFDYANDSITDFKAAMQSQFKSFKNVI